MKKIIIIATILGLTVINAYGQDYKSTFYMVDNGTTEYSAYGKTYFKIDGDTLVATDKKFKEVRQKFILNKVYTHENGNSWKWTFGGDDKKPVAVHEWINSFSGRVTRTVYLCKKVK
jgi:hypothetical protein